MKENCKLCFSTLGCCERSLPEILTLCANFHIPYLEIRGIDGQMDNRKIGDFWPETIEKTKAAFQKAGVTPLVLGTSCYFHDKEKFEGFIEEGKRSLEIAALLGAKGIRVFGNRLGENPAESTARLIEGLRILCDFSPANLKVLLEVHGDFNTEESLRPVAEAMKNQPRFGLIWDIEHTHRTYRGRQTDFYAAFAPLIYHVHIKDDKEGVLTLPGEGDMPITQIIKDLQEAGYTGAYSLEWEKKWHPELPSMEEALCAFINLVPKTEE